MPVDANTRAARFLNAMAHQETPITVHAFSASQSKGRTGRRFLNALKMALPVLVLTSSVYAQTPIPELNLSIDNSAVDSMQLMKTIEKIGSYFNEKSTVAEQDREQVKNVANCFRHTIANTDLSLEQRAFAGIFIGVQASHIYKEIQSIAAEQNLSEAIGLAAYCENPLNWKAQLNHWVQQAQKTQAQLQAHLDAPENPSEITQNNFDTFLGVYASEILEKNASQYASQYEAVQEAAYFQYQTYINDAELRQKVNGYDWVNAAISISRGVGSLVGGREGEHEANKVGRVMRDGVGVARHVERAGDRDGASRWSEIGRAVQGVGRMVHDSPIMRSPNQRMR